MERSSLPRELRPFIDASGRLSSWPAKQKTQRLVCTWLVQRFEPGREYREKEVNSLLMDAHRFADWALLRRSLIDFGHLEREGDGSRYWRAAATPPAAKPAPRGEPGE